MVYSMKASIMRIYTVRENYNFFALFRILIWLFARKISSLCMGHTVWPFLVLFVWNKWFQMTINERKSPVFIRQASLVAYQIGKISFFLPFLYSLSNLCSFYLTCFRAVGMVPESKLYRSKHIFNRKGSDWNSAEKVSHYVGFDCVSLLGRISNGTPGS